MVSFSSPAWLPPLINVLFPSNLIVVSPFPETDIAALSCLLTLIVASFSVTSVVWPSFELMVTVLSVVFTSLVSASLVVITTSLSRRSLISPLSSETYLPSPSVCVTVCWLFLNPTLMPPLVRSYTSAKAGAAMELTMESTAAVDRTRNASFLHFIITILLKKLFQRPFPGKTKSAAPAVWRMQRSG